MLNHVRAITIFFMLFFNFQNGHGQEMGNYWITEKGFQLKCFMSGDTSKINLFDILKLKSQIKKTKNMLIILEGVFPGHEAHGIAGDRSLVFSFEVNSKKVAEISFNSQDFWGDSFSKIIPLETLLLDENIDSFIINLVQGSIILKKVILLQ